MRSARLLGILLACAVTGCATMAPPMGGAGRLIISGNDGKLPIFDAAYKVAEQVVPDTLTVLDGSTFPPKLVAQIEVQHSVTAPPMAVALSPDKKLALVSAPNRVDPRDRTKVVTDNFIQVVDLETTPPRVIAKVEIGRHPLGVSINRKGDLALAAHADGNISVLAIQAKAVRFVDTVKIGEPSSSPRHVAITPDGKWALAAKRGEDVVSVLKIEGTKVTYTKRDITVGNNPYGIEITPDGRLAVVANLGRGEGSNDSITVIDLTREPLRAVDHVAVGQTPEGIAISPDGQWLAVTVINGTNKAKDSPFRAERGKLLLYSLRDARPLKLAEADTGKNTQGVSFTPDGRHILVQNYVEKELAVYKLVGSSLEDTGVRISVPGHPAAIRIAPR
jgi:6-phosphogluconolactonase (cycloisomerase 2 family)